MQPPILSSPSLKKNCTCIWLYQSGQSALFYSLPLTQGAETYLLRQQSVGGRRNQVFKDGANLSLSKCRPEAPPYFQAHPVIERIGIEFQPRLSMKGQVMADFVLEYSRRPIQHKEQVKKVDFVGRWSLTIIRIRSRLLLQSQQEEHLEQAIGWVPASNNEAEYEAILSGLDLALALSVSKLRSI
ncbi:hypothetical protein CK203_092710 [Vitis vinifera]|uniref:Uncharacterized protein n=1 Tax=Vitis vinifera TaxID=29760 RepID=A0A438D837_VITVI|nr:hypothetical protein CK203_092710 [Vitis vinifera]